MHPLENLLLFCKWQALRGHDAYMALRTLPLRFQNLRIEVLI